jgi:hypothetical protein
VNLDARRAGEALRAAAGDLVRLWRSTRRAAGETDLVGALDGVMEEFLERVAEALLQGTPPEEVWPRTGGVVRIPPGPGGAARIEAEWRLAGGVLTSAGQALQVSDDVAARLQRSVSAAIAALPFSPGGAGRPGEVLVVWTLPAVRRRSGPRGGGPP